ncbi:hypothetical protein [Longitalea luteola]|uniref:hypothetical protein n=1 Tax=Longitalea luteola TaxID=2812563 RepID=UPI001A9774D6|nr:hypothetical protein [Longitalea luteola]
MPANRLPVAGCQVPVAGFRFPVTSYRLPVARYRLPVSGYRLSVSGYRLSVSGYLLPVAGCQLPVTCYQDRILNLALSRPSLKLRRAGVLRSVLRVIRFAALHIYVVEAGGLHC